MQESQGALWCACVCVCVCVYIYIYTTSSLSIPVNGHLGCLQALAVVNSDAMNIRVHVFS